MKHVFLGGVVFMLLSCSPLLLDDHRRLARMSAEPSRSALTGLCGDADFVRADLVVQTSRSRDLDAGGVAPSAGQAKNGSGEGLVFFRGATSYTGSCARYIDGLSNGGVTTSTGLRVDGTTQGLVVRQALPTSENRETSENGVSGQGLIGLRPLIEAKTGGAEVRIAGRCASNGEAVEMLLISLPFKPDAAYLSQPLHDRWSGVSFLIEGYDKATVVTYDYRLNDESAEC